MHIKTENKAGERADRIRLDDQSARGASEGRRLAQHDTAPAVPPAAQHRGEGPTAGRASRHRLR